MAQYLAKYGAKVLDRGYAICFIRPGEKRPFGKDWESTVHGANRLASSITAGRGGFGVGIKTRKTPAVDVDCYDRETVEHMKRFVIALCGPTLERVGLAPKTLLVYRTTEPFRKIQSAQYYDDEQRMVKLEVLGDGQQFVAFHTHPETGEPYRWLDKRAPHVVPAADLPTITAEQAQQVADEFDRIAVEKGWVKVSAVKRTQQQQPAGQVDLDDPFISDKSKIELSADTLRAKLQAVPGCEDYDTWFQIGMALYHQFDGSDDGLIMWHEWSSQATNYDSDALDEKWASFDIEGKRREPLTARFILKMAQAEEERIATEELGSITESIREATDLAAIREVAEQIKHLAFDQLTRESLVNDIRKQIKAVSGTTMSISSVRQLVRFENPENRTMPTWLEGYVYCQQDDTFYSLKTRQALSRTAFENSFSRFMMTRKDRLEGRTTPEHSAAQVALNRYQIPVVAARMYLPTEDPVFTLNGLDYANSYNDSNIPAPPAKMSAAGLQAVERVKAHVDLLFAVPRERELLLDWMCYIVQTGQRVNWAPIIQGAESDGKTFFHSLLGVVLGAENVTTIPGEALAGTNTAWAEGAQFCFIEEIRLHGANRFDVLNKMKPFITNSMVSVRRMAVDWYNVINTMSYMLATNHKDGMPVDANDTRYFPLFSRFQSPEVLQEFKAANPTYYADLYATINHGAELRKWMLERPLSKWFSPVERAPVSVAKAEMISLNMSDEEEDFAHSIAESTDRRYSNTLLDSNLVGEKMGEIGGIAPYGRTLKKMLSDRGFTLLGRFSVNGHQARWWSKTPERFTDGEGVVSADRIRDYIEDL